MNREVKYFLEIDEDGHETLETVVAWRDDILNQFGLDTENWLRRGDSLLGVVQGGKKALTRISIEVSAIEASIANARRAIPDENQEDGALEGWMGRAERRVSELETLKVRITHALRFGVYGPGYRPGVLSDCLTVRTAIAVPDENFLDSLEKALGYAREEGDSSYLEILACYDELTYWG